VPIAFATTRIRARLVTAREPEARALGVTRATAVLELEERLHLASGEVTHLARDLFAPEGLDLHVVRWLEAARPARLTGAARPG
jgi:DNA-binding GntR family transcriptional regulator